MFSNRLLVKLKSTVLYSNFNSKSLSKICASNYHFNLKLINQNRDSWMNKNSLFFFSNKSAFSSTDAKTVKSYNENPVTEVPLSAIEQKQAEYAKLHKEQFESIEKSIQTVDDEANEKNEERRKSILEPYFRLMRLNSPIPILLTYWPSAWAILGAASYLNTTPDLYLLSLFALGAIGMRSAGCIVNDMWDRKIDKQVERTKDRPLANGTVGMPAAVALLGANLSVSLAVLMQLDITTQVLGACCLFPVAVYPAAKRFTDWPQAILGVTFNWGALMGWSAVLCSSAATMPHNILSFLPAAALYAGAINWTLFYDTIYGFQDKKYDEKLGLKSTSIQLQKNPRRWLLGFSSMFGTNLALFGYLTAQEPIFYISLGVVMAHFLKQTVMVKKDDPKSCMRQFNSNNTIGILLTFGLLANVYLKNF